MTLNALSLFNDPLSSYLSLARSHLGMRGAGGCGWRAAISVEPWLRFDGCVRGCRQSFDPLVPKCARFHLTDRTASYCRVIRHARSSSTPDGSCLISTITF